MFLFLDVYISTIYLSIIHVDPLVVIVRLHLRRAAILATSRLHRSTSLFYYMSPLCDSNRSHKHA